MPLFQRQYAWDADDQVRRFLSDLDALLEEQSDTSFLGAIVLQEAKVGSAGQSQEFTVIDGQQRLTTFYLFLSAISATAKELGYEILAQDIVDQYLVGRLSRERGKPKLLPTIPDNTAFNHVVQKVSDHIHLLPKHGQDEGKITNAFQACRNYISSRLNVDDTLLSLENIRDKFLNGFEIVSITLDKTYNANEVFDRLNNGGQPLRVIDLVRNELFQLVVGEYDYALDFYKRHWAPFESKFETNLSDGSSQDFEKLERVVDGFFFPYLLTRNPNARKNQILEELRKVWKRFSHGDNDLEPRAIVADLERMIAPYLAIEEGIRPDGVPDELWRSIQDLRAVPIPGVSTPYFMNLLDGVIHDSGNVDDAVASCRLVESFFVRRGLVGLEPTGLHSVFKRLWQSAGSDPAKVSAEVQTRTISFPDDEELVRAICEKPLYGRRVEKYVLGQYEMSLQDSSISSLSHLPSISTDHVMPQAWIGEWRTEVSSEEHDLVKDLWGNLVPLSNPANSAKGAKDYEEVRKLLSDEALFKTTIRLLRSNKNWGPDQIRVRSKDLAEWARGRWVAPE